MAGKREITAKRPRRGRLIALILTAAFLFWIPLELFVSNNMPVAEHITVILPRLPQGFDGLRIAHLSDLHEKTFGKNNGTLLTMIRKAEPHIIAVTGDLIDSEGGLAYAQELLGELAAIAPVYYVTGNHEWKADGPTAYMGRNRLMARLESTVTQSGAFWLDSGVEPFPLNGEVILLAGLCDALDRTAPNVHEMRQIVTDAYGDDRFTILLSHRFDIDYSESGFDLVLAGHAHGGVVRLPFTDGLIGPARDWLPKGTSGLLRQGDTQLVVSRGLGDTYFPRFLNRPQVLVVTLKR
jgi:hypothetical protein